MKRILMLLMVLMLAFGVMGCQANDAEQTGDQAAVNAEDVSSVETTEENEAEGDSQAVVYPLEITDHAGRSVVIEKRPERIISLAPSITEVIYALDAGDRLVGRTDYCTYPLEVEDVPSIGALKSPNIEAITAMEPDVIIASTHFQEQTMEKLESLGLTVVVLSSEDSFEGVYSVISKAGDILDEKDKANEVVSGMQAKVQSVLEAVEGLEKPLVYYVVGFGEYGDHTAGGDTFISQIIEMAGGENTAADVNGWSYSLERLVEKDPEILVCSAFFNSKEEIAVASGYKDLSAVKSGMLFEIDSNILDRQGPRLAEGLETLARIIHPEAFE